MLRKIRSQVIWRDWKAVCIDAAAAGPGALTVFDICRRCSG